MRSPVLTTIALLSTLTLPGPSQARQDKLPTPAISITGLNPKSKFKGDELFFEVSEVSFGAMNAANLSASSGAGAGKVQFSELTFSHKVDLISSDLFFYCASGKIVPTVSVRLGGDIMVTLSNVVITNYKIGQTGSSDLPQENITLAFTKVRIEKTIQDAKGTKTSFVFAEWDRLKNTGSSSGK